MSSMCRATPSVDNTEWLTAGDTDFDFNMPSMHIRTIEAGAAIKMLTGVHTGCFELMANDSIAGVADLKGKRVGIWGFDNHPQILLSLMANYVGLDPAHDIEWVIVDYPMQDFHRRQDRCLPPLATVPGDRVPKTSATRSSAMTSTGHGRNISAAWSPAAPTM